MNDSDVVAIDRIDCAYAPWSWPFAADRRKDIDTHFQTLQRDNCALWNGRLLLLRDVLIVDGEFRGTCFETDYASLLAGLDWGAIGGRVKGCFGVAALVAADGAFVVGEMASHTRNAGQIYFPSGSFDPDDVVDDRLDVFASIQRELAEETGLPPDELDPEVGWHAVFSGPHVPLVKVMRAKEVAGLLRSRILANLRSQQEPEFSDVHVVYGRSDLSPRMPAWMRAYLLHIWS